MNASQSLNDRPVVDSTTVDGMPPPVEEKVVKEKVAEKVENLGDGLALVDEAIETGRARETLEKLVRLSHGG